MGDVAAGTPWWYLTRTMKQSGVIGGVQTPIGVVGLVGYSLYGGPIRYLFFSLCWLVLGGMYLASAVARRRRERSRHASLTAMPPGLPPSS
jgi:hypothetical protein